MSKRKVFGDSDDSAEEDFNTEISNDQDVSEEEAEQLLPSDSDNSDDEAPEDVSLEQSRVAAMKLAQGALTQIRSIKERDRERKRHWQERNLKQKQEKLAALEESRLPQSLLDELPPAPATEKSHKKTTKKKCKEHDQDQEELDLGSTEELSGGEAEDDEDFLALDKSQTGVHAMYIEDVRSPKTLVDKALEFKTQQLYGKKVHRESTRSMLSKKIKRKARFT